jgi:uncharacterized protein (TIRG00374 family)
MVLGSLVFVLYLYFFIGPADVLEAARNINAADYVVFYSLALGTMLLVIFLWAASWKFLLDDLGVKVKFKDAFLYYSVGYFVDLVMPIQSAGGEVTRVYLVHRETNHNYGAVAASTIINRIIAYTVLTVGLSASSIYLLVRSTVPDFALGLLLLTWAGAVISLGVLLYLGFGDHAAQKLATKLLKTLQFLHLKRPDEQLSQRSVKALVMFEEGFKFFRSHPRRVLAPALLQAIAFILNLVVYIWVFFALGFGSLSFDFFLIVFFLAAAIQEAAGVFSVGGLDILLTNLFTFFSIPVAASGVAAAILRIAIFWFPLLVGYGIAHYIGVRAILNGRTRENMAEKEKALDDKNTSGVDSASGGEGGR